MHRFRILKNPITPDTELQAPNQNTTTVNSTDSEKVGKLQNYFKLRFTKLDFGQLVANSLEKFLLFCNQKLQNVYPNHTCINATQGSVIIEFQGDEQYKDAIGKFVSEWITEDVLKDPVFADSTLSSTSVKQEPECGSFTLVIILTSVASLFFIFCAIYCCKTRCESKSSEKNDVDDCNDTEIQENEDEIMCHPIQEVNPESVQYADDQEIECLDFTRKCADEKEPELVVLEAPVV
jgi:hypothetical protein